MEEILEDGGALKRWSAYSCTYICIALRHSRRAFSLIYACPTIRLHTQLWNPIFSQVPRATRCGGYSSCARSASRDNLRCFLRVDNIYNDDNHNYGDDDDDVDDGGIINKSKREYVVRAKFLTSNFLCAFHQYYNIVFLINSAWKSTSLCVYVSVSFSAFPLTHW